MLAKQLFCFSLNMLRLRFGLFFAKCKNLRFVFCEVSLSKLFTLIMEFGKMSDLQGFQVCNISLNTFLHS